MAEVILPLRESQVLELARQLSPEGKRALLQTLIPDLGQFEALVEYGNARIRALCQEKGLDWDSLSEEQRERLVDDLLMDPARFVERLTGGSATDDKSSS